MNPFRQNGDERQTKNISPPLPPFRSVSMTATMSPAFPVLQQPNEHLRRSKTIPTKKHANMESTSSNKDDDGSSSSSSCCWKWTLGHEASPVPLYHPLERTAFCSTDNLDTITGRISTFMKLHSIHCTYHNDLGRVDCSTCDLLHFVVQLWKKSDHETVIEIQRRQGCSITMVSLRQKLIQTIRYGSPQDDDTNTTIKTNKQELTSSLRTCNFLQQLPVPQASSSSSPPDCLDQCLEISKQLLNSDLLDQNRLGLESLLLLTDSSKVLLEDTIEVSKQVLQGDSSLLQGLLIKFLVRPATIHQDMQTVYEALHLLTLKILSNVLEVCRRVQRDESVNNINLNNLFWSTVIQVSHENIQLVRQRPIEASYSIKCLRLLHYYSPPLLLESEEESSSLLQDAHDVGRRHNRSLEKETELFMLESPMAH